MPLDQGKDKCRSLLLFHFLPRKKVPTKNFHFSTGEKVEHEHFSVFFLVHSFWEKGWLVVWNLRDWKGGNFVNMLLRTLQTETSSRDTIIYTFPKSKWFSEELIAWFITWRWILREEPWCIRDSLSPPRRRDRLCSKDALSWLEETQGRKNRKQIKVIFCI